MRQMDELDYYSSCCLGLYDGTEIADEELASTRANRVSVGS